MEDGICTKSSVISAAMKNAYRDVAYYCQSVTKKSGWSRYIHHQIFKGSQKHNSNFLPN